MAGMFYSLREVAAKLGKNEDEVRQLVKQGQLREFRDGSTVLFKVDEVESLGRDLKALEEAGSEGGSEAGVGGLDDLELEEFEGGTDSLDLNLAEEPEGNKGEEISDDELMSLLEDNGEGTDAQKTQELKPVDFSDSDLMLGGDEGDASEDDAESGKTAIDMNLSLDEDMSAEDTDRDDQMEVIAEDEEAIEVPETEIGEGDIEMEEEGGADDGLEELESALNGLGGDEEQVEAGGEEEVELSLDEGEEVGADKPVSVDSDIMLLDDQEAGGEGEAEDELMPELSGEDVESASGGLEAKDEADDSIGLEDSLAGMEDESELTGGGSLAELGIEDDEGSTADTQIGDTGADEGVSILGDSDAGEYKLASDTHSDTMGSDEVSLEEIEEDVNLDSFGSGSGLLDLSLQADDTSLGGVLDEIYTPEGVEGDTPGSGIDPGTVAEQILAEEDLSVPEPAVQVAAVEAEPDSSSNILGAMLILPLIVAIYTGIVALAGAKGVVPAVLSPIQGLIWPIVGGVAVVSLIWAVVGFMAGGGASKPKKAKAAKPRKEKKVKPKKEKKAKAPKAKKEKKARKKKK